MKSRNLLFVKRSLYYIRTIVILALIIVLLPQCAVKRPPLSTGVVDKVALIATTVNFQQQLGISGPAAVARGQFNKRAIEINSLMSNYADTFHFAVASNLKNQLGCEVLFGKELHALPQYNELRKKYERAEALNKEDENFPEVLISSGDFNFIIAQTKVGPMNGGKTVFLDPDELKVTIPNLCQELNVKHIAVAQFVFTGFRTSLILPTDTYLNYTLYLYNQYGNLIALSSNNERTVKLLEIDLTGSFRDMVKAYLGKSELIELQPLFSRKK